MSTKDSMEGKASFDDIYDQADPRAYIRELGGLEYQIPEHARDVFRFLIGELRAQRSGDFAVADLCCSYGINAALVNHELLLEEFYARYQSDDVAALPTEELIAADRAFYAARRRPEAVPMIGVDAAARAVDYAKTVGILDVAASENLEESYPSEGLAQHLAEVGLVTVTGGVGYITEATFDRLLSVTEAGRPPWVAAFTLRWVDMSPIASALDKHGIRLERLDGRTFRQRRFADDEERDYALAELRRLGIDPEGVETDGYHHTWVYVGRPHAESERVPLDRLLAPVLRKRGGGVPDDGAP